MSWYVNNDNNDSDYDDNDSNEIDDNVVMSEGMSLRESVPTSSSIFVTFVIHISRRFLQTTIFAKPTKGMGWIVRRRKFYQALH